MMTVMMTPSRDKEIHNSNKRDNAGIDVIIIMITMMMMVK